MTLEQIELEVNWVINNSENINHVDINEIYEVTFKDGKCQLQPGVKISLVKESCETEGTISKVDELKRLRKTHWNSLIQMLKSPEADHDKISQLLSALALNEQEGNRRLELAFKKIDKEILSIKLFEGDYTNADLGWKTWGASVLMSKLLLQLEVCEDRVLEIGCGTGLAGQVLAKKGDFKVWLTDYNEHVLKLTEKSVVENNIGDKVSVCKLDWRTFDQVEVDCDKVSFDLVIACDVLYSIEHSVLVPQVVKNYLKSNGLFYIMIPLRPNYAEEVELFEQEILKQGFKVVHCSHYFDFYLDCNTKLPELIPSENDEMTKTGCFYRFLIYELCN
jgi:2-polyprenyl-3-methyl-5-hydroxy-6-metoxy-1,4-benzoquinol methylase